MKKLLVFVITVILILAISSVSLAVVEIGGDARFGFTSNFDGNNFSSFVFDRFAIFINADFSEKSGIKSEIRFAGNIGLDHAYYYQKNLFTTDELNIGYLPLNQFCNQNTISLVGSLAQLPPFDSQSLGAKYSLKFEKLEASVAFLNANDQGYQNNISINGYEEIIRIIFLPINNLTVGAGYFNDKGLFGNDSYFTVDLTYQMNPFNLYLEFDSRIPDGASAESGFYFEGTYKVMDNLIVYLGGTFVAQSSGLLPSDYYCVGAKLQLAPQTEIQGEYVIYANNADSNSLNVRMKLNF